MPYADNLLPDSHQIILLQQSVYQEYIIQYALHSELWSESKQENPIKKEVRWHKLQKQMYYSYKDQYTT